MSCNILNFMVHGIKGRKDLRVHEGRGKILPVDRNQVGKGRGESFSPFLFYWL